MSIISSAVKKPVTTALCFVAIIIFGMYSFNKLSIDLLPKINENTILVMTSYPGASASDIEMNISKPIENGLNSVSDLKHITSSSRENVSVVMLELEYDVDIDEATNDVRDKLDVVKSSLPDDSDNPIIFKFGANDIPILILSATSDESTNALYKILDDKVANPLGRISGVGTVAVVGTAQREVNVYCDPYKLNAYGMTVEGLSEKIALENRNIPGGNMDIGSNSFSVRVQGEFTDANQLLNIVIGHRDGKNIFLRDVARVEDSLQERAQEAIINGERGAIVIIQKQAGGNSVNIAKEVKEKLPELQAVLPTDVKIDVLMDTTNNIENTMNSLLETIMITLVIVMLVVFVFLGRWRATVIIAVTIPVSLIGAFIYLYATGNTLNIISMSALSLAIGMVVDDAIVVLENIMTHIERGSKPKQAAIYGTKEMMISVIASTLTMLCVFLPLTMVSGMAGVLFTQLGWIVSIIMIISTLAALTLIPMMCSQMLKLDNKKGRLYTLFFTPIDKSLSWLERMYSKLLNWGVNHRKSVIIIAVAVFGSSMLLLPYIKTEFIPTMDSGIITASVEMPIGTRQSISQEVAGRISDELTEKYPEIKVINYVTGQASSDDTFSNMSENGTHIISFRMVLSSVEERKRGMLEICDLMRKDLAEYTEIERFKVSAGGDGGSMMGEASVDVEIYGFDFSVTDKFAAELSERLASLPECSQTTISRGDYIPEIQVDFDREKLAENGLDLTTAAAFIRNRINGSTLSYYREEGEEYDIKVRYAPEFRQSTETIEDITIYNSLGHAVRVRDIATINETMTPPTIERKNRERIITVSAIASQGYALSELVTAIQTSMETMEIPAEANYKLAGSFEDQQETFNDLFTLMALIIILVFIVMAAQFESLTDPFIIMFSIPFAFTGVFLGLWVTDTALGVMALIGILILLGVVVKNGIVLIDYIRLCRERGMGITEAVLTAGKSRLRPVLMTTMTTVLGMLPMALGTGEGSEMWRSMGMTVAWGLSISTVITLILIPVMYCIFANNGMKRKQKKEAKIEVLEQLSE